MAPELPPREMPSRDSFPHSPRKVRHWVRRLAALEMRSATGEFHQGLAALNRLQLTPRRRARLLELVVPVARSITGQLEKRLSSQALPLPEKSRRLHELLLELIEEMALGYAAVLVDETAGGRRPTARRAALAAQRALSWHGRYLLQCARVYSAPPARLWQGIHATYARAERAGLTERKVRDDTLQRSRRRRQTVAEAYKRILLFALANTDGLRKGESDRIYRLLETWAPAAVLATPAAGETQARFAVRLDIGRPPLQRRFADTSSAEHLRTLDPDPVVRLVERARAAADQGENPLLEADAVNAHALGRLLDSWTQRSLRRSERVERGESIEVEVTLAGIHVRLLADSRPAVESRPDPGASASISLTLQTIDQDDARPGGTYLTHPGHDRVRDTADTWDDVGRGRVISAVYRQARHGPAAAADGANAPATSGNWLLEDSSATGFRLRWEGEGSSRAVVGELLAVHEPDGGNGAAGWRVGVIRWLRFIDQRYFEVGAKTLSARVSAATVRREPAERHRKRQREKEPAEPALLLPGVRSRNEPATVLLPAHMFRREEILELDLRDKMLRIRLGEIREHTGSFTQFVVIPAPKRGERSVDDRTARGPRASR